MDRSRIGRLAPYAVTLGAFVACSTQTPSSSGGLSSEESFLLQDLEDDHDALAHEDGRDDDAVRGFLPVTLGLRGWHVQSSAVASQPAEQISRPGFSTAGWLPVRPDDAGAPGTEINALVQNGECPEVFFSDNMRKCFGYMPVRGPVTVARFAVPWWFRTDFTVHVERGQRAKLIVPGVVGEGDVWVNGELVASREIVTGAFAGHTFDISRLVRPGKNTLAIKMYPNDPNSMFTLDNVDWTQIPPDNQTGIQFPIQLQVTSKLSGTNAHVVQHNAPDLSSSALTVKVDVTNDSHREQEAVVGAAVIAPSGGGAPILVRQKVTVPARSTKTVSFTPDHYPGLNIARPRAWWPYLLGDQPLYTLRTAVFHDGEPVSRTRDTFGIRTVNSRLIGASPQAPQGARIFGINGKEFVFRGAGYAPDLLLRYSKADIARQITLIKNLGLSGIRLEGHDMPRDFYDQFDRAGIPIIGGFTCCNRWELPADGAGVTERDYRVIHDSSYSIGQLERNHPSVINYGWSDNEPIPRQEAESLRGFAEADFDVPIVASAEYKSTPTLGPSGEKEGPYDWVPPSYWYDTTHFSPGDPSRTNAGGSWGFGSEQSAGHTVPTLDSIRRFLSQNEQDKLWRQPDYNQYHANFEPGYWGYQFGTLFVFDKALAARYGQWSDLESYVKEAHVANYENVRAEFESFIEHSTDPNNPSTGVIYWQLNKGWPTLLWSLYNYDGDQPGSYFGAKEANRPLHALYAYDKNTVTVANLGARIERDLSVQARVYDRDGNVLDDQTARGIALDSQQVKNKVLTLKVPAATTPPAPARVFFVQLLLRQGGKVVDRNVYWRSTQEDVVDWEKSLGKPQATLSQYGNLQDLKGLPKSALSVVADTRRGHGPNGANTVTSVTVTNTSSKPVVGFFLRADVRRGTPGGAELPGDNQVQNALWDDNDITLWPGESQVLHAVYDAGDLKGAAPVVSVTGWNTDRIVVRAP
ncbi:glycosyl hydrolase 2 galactose-binding domain-containing protein [Pendulispora albinea]|uniref:Exo-1,4-beta-D-glucosaminidase n=1 Tax=Pendulispora albinea TaxID=2741071 RepID=A0ABZ2M3G0_9BACT